MTWVMIIWLVGGKADIVTGMIYSSAKACEAERYAVESRFQPDTVRTRCDLLPSALAVRLLRGIAVPQEKQR